VDPSCRDPRRPQTAACDAGARGTRPTGCWDSTITGAGVPRGTKRRSWTSSHPAPVKRALRPPGRPTRLQRPALLPPRPARSGRDTELLPSSSLHCKRPDSSPRDAPAGSIAAREPRPCLDELLQLDGKPARLARPAPSPASGRSCAQGQSPVPLPPRQPCAALLPRIEVRGASLTRPWPDNPQQTTTPDPPGRSGRLTTAPSF
jgi:hypothetical protein